MSKETFAFIDEILLQYLLITPKMEAVGVPERFIFSTGLHSTTLKGEGSLCMHSCDNLGSHVAFTFKLIYFLYS
jgi:hypothetical protein